MTWGNTRVLPDQVLLPDETEAVNPIFVDTSTKQGHAAHETDSVNFACEKHILIRNYILTKHENRDNHNHTCIIKYILKSTKAVEKCRISKSCHIFFFILYIYFIARSAC